MSPYCIPDDPIVRCMEKYGVPPWQVYKDYGYCEDEEEWEEEEADVFYGNESEGF